MSLNRNNSWGKYRVIAELGHGGMADVYLAVVQGPVGFNKLQVIKQLRPHLAEVPDFLTMFLDEARLAARLNHPNVVQTNEVVEEGNRYFIAMEYLDGQSLDRILRRASKDARLTLPMRLRILADVLAGLHYAHELTDFDGTPLRVVHRDVTPHNVFVTYDGQVKVVDFGIAKAANGSAETRTGVLKGKIAYMPPEQAKSDPVDRRADIFSVGLMLWECICDERPWKNLSDIQILSRLGQGQLPNLRDAKPDAPLELERIFMKATALRREDRYATAADMQADLEQYLERVGGRAGSRDLGKVISEMYAEKRAEIRTIIEAQLRNAKQPNNGEYQAALLSRLDVPGSYSMNQSPPSMVPNIGEHLQGEDTPTTAATPLSRSTSASRPAVASSLPAAASPRRSMALGAGIAAALLGAVGLGVFITQKLAPPSSQLVQPTGEAQVQQIGAPPASTLAELSVRAEPASAKVFLDDAPLSNPAKVKLPRDGATHKLRAEAPGYATKHELISLSADMTAELVLEELHDIGAALTAKTTGTSTARAAATVAAKDPKEAAPDPAATAPAPTATTRKDQPPKRQLDADDPWAK